MSENYEGLEIQVRSVILELRAARQQIDALQRNNADLADCLFDAFSWACGRAPDKKVVRYKEALINAGKLPYDAK